MSITIDIIDGNSIAHACHEAPPLTVNGMQVQAIYGFLRTLRSMLREAPSKPIVLWDGTAQFRFDLYPDYKIRRRTPGDAEHEASRAAFKKQGPLLEKALEFLGVIQMRSPLLEADDLAHHLVQAMPGRKIRMVTGDRDWLRMVRPNCSWHDPIRSRRVTTINFLDFTGYHSPDEWAQGKCITGDMGDDVPGIKGMGEGSKETPVFIAKWKTVQAFFDAVDNGTYTPKSRASKTAKTLHPEQFLASPEGRAIFARNVKLLDLRHARKPLPGEVVTTHGAPQPERFKALCERLAFLSILRELPEFLQAFGVDRASTSPALEAA
jgi:5'-3' exonuclease